MELIDKKGGRGVMDTEVMFSSKTDLWETPQDFFDNLPENAKCDTYYTPEQDGLSQPWKGVV